MRYTELQANSIIDKNRSCPTICLMIPQRTRTRAMDPHQRGHITCQQHSVYNTTPKAGPKRKVFVQVQWIAIAAQFREELDIFRSDRLMKLNLIARFNLFKICKLMRLVRF